MIYNKERTKEVPFINIKSEWKNIREQGELKKLQCIKDKIRKLQAQKNLNDRHDALILLLIKNGVL